MARLLDDVDLGHGADQRLDVLVVDDGALEPISACTSPRRSPNTCGAAELDVRVAEPVAFALVGLVESAATRWLDSPGGVSSEELSTDLKGWAWAVVDQATRSAGLTLDPHAIMPRLAELMGYPPPRGA